MRRRGVLAGVGIAVVLFGTFGGSTPAGASPRGVFDEPVPRVLQCGWSTFAGESNVVLPCPAVFQEWWGDWIYGLQSTLTGFALLPVAEIAENYVDAYIGEPLEGVPFFGSGLAELARAVVVTPFQVFEWVYDEFVYPLVSFGLDIASSIAGFVGFLADSALAAVWAFAMHGLAWFGNYAYGLFSLLDLGLQQVAGFLSDIPGQILELFVYPSDLLFLGDGILQLRTNFLDFAFTFAGVFSAVTIESASSSACVPMPGDQCVNIFGVFDSMPPGLGIAVAAFTGFWMVFVVVQAVGAIARMTDAS